MEPYYTTPALQILYNKTLAKNRASWINDLLETNKDELFLTPYPALSCIGAKGKIWRQLMNFEDCPDYLYDVREIPFTYVSRANETFRPIYRRVNEKTGCFKTYKENPPQSALEVYDYLLDSYSEETLALIGSDIPGDAWYIDQKLASLRIGQWGKRHGYEKIFTYNNENPKYPYQHFKRLDRTPEFRDVVAYFDYESNKIDMIYKDSHFDRHTIYLNRFWKTAVLLEKVLGPENFHLVAKFRLNYLKKNLRNRNNDVHLINYFKIIREARELFNCDINLVRTELHPITFQGENLPDCYRVSSRFAVWKWTHKLKLRNSGEHRENV